MQHLGEGSEKCQVKDRIYSWNMIIYQHMKVAVEIVKVLLAEDWE